MKTKPTLAVIGHGNVGGTLAKGWARAGYQVIIGYREPEDEKLTSLQQAQPSIQIATIKEAAQAADVVVIAAVPDAVKSIAESLTPYVASKVVIETMNSVGAGPAGYQDTFTALTELLPGADLIKCFNSTGFENMANPVYAPGLAADMFMAGGSPHAKETALELAQALGFESCFDFGGPEQVALLEQFAKSWINLALRQGLGRQFMFKVHFRP